MMRLLAVLSIVTLLASSVHAQEGTERLAPFAHGAGRTYALTARGLDAVEINPALLALGTPRSFEFTLAPFTSIGANTGLSFNTINDVATGLKGDSIIGNAKVTNSFYHNQLSADLGLRVFGLSYYKPNVGTFALTWDIHAAMRANIPDSILIYLTPPNDTVNFINGRVLTPQHVDVQGIWYHQYGLSFGTDILRAEPGGVDLASGITLSYVRGVAYMRVNPNSFVSFNDADVTQLGQYPTNIITQYDIQFATPDIFNGSLPDAPTFGLITGASAGWGGGISVGFAAAEHPGIPKDSTDLALPRWRAGLSLSDLGFIRWSSHTDIRRQDSTVVSINHKGGDTFGEDSIRSYLKQLSGTLDTTDAPFTSSLPTTLHMAGEIDLSVVGLSIPNTSLMLATELALGLTDVVGSPHKGRFGTALILDRPSPNVGFRTALGITTQDGATNLTFAIGTTLWNRFSLDFGSANILGFISGNGQSDAALGMKIMF
jgi:hypothetical protein